MTWALAGLMAVFAVVMGVAPTLLGAKISLLMFLAVLPLPLILKDYRLGVLLLTLALPMASMLPPIRGLNLLNFLTLATLGSFVLQGLFSKTKTLWPSSRMVVCFLLPVTIGMVVAWPHIPEAARNYAHTASAAEAYNPATYALNRFFKPLFYFVSYAFLLANAIRASKRPELFVVALAASVLLPAMAVAYTVATYPGSLGDVAQDREFLAARGMHANRFGLLFALACGPLLFVSGATHSRWLRWVTLLAFGAATIGLLLTFSRGALLAYLIVVSAYLLHHRRIRTLAASAVLIGAAMLTAPEALKERFGTGLRADALSDTTNIAKDDLTAGRVHGWLLLLPEVPKSPLIGRGLGSTQWSEAVANGQYRATHPHNVYLEVLMDLGVIGFAAMAYWIFREMGSLRHGAREPGLSDGMRGYFLGARYALWGLLAMAATTGDYMPYSGAHTYLWFTFGVLFAYGDASARPAAATAAEPSDPALRRAAPPAG
jgi:O-antigen ligase